jgi:hypothetical protein
MSCQLRDCAKVSVNELFCCIKQQNANLACRRTAAEAHLIRRVPFSFLFFFFFFLGGGGDYIGPNNSC